MDPADNSLPRESDPKFDLDEVPLIYPGDYREEQAKRSLRPPIRSLSLKHAAHRRLSMRLLLPTLAVVIVNAGLGFTMIAWFITHSTQASLGQIFAENAFLIDEGMRHEDGIDTASLRGLTISTTASTAIGLTAPILLTLYAFRTAHIWLRGRPGDLPTPLQYGLILQNLGAAGIFSLFNTGSYLLKRRSKRAPAVYMLSEAFAVALIAYILVHIVAAVDIWLHTVAAAFTQTSIEPLSNMSNFTVNTEPCAPYEGETALPCYWSASGWHGDVGAGMQISSNSSRNFSAITLANASDLAILIGADIPQDVAFTAVTRGARASCQSITQSCNSLDNGPLVDVASCTGFPSTFPPNTSSAFDSETSNVFIQSSNCTTCEHVNSIDSDFNIGTISTEAGNNPHTPTIYSLWMQFIWFAAGTFIATSNIPPNSTVLQESGAGVTMLVNCSLAFYDVTVSYTGGNFSRISENLAERANSDSFATPTRLGVYAYRLLSDVEGIAFSDATEDSVMAYLNQDLARMAVAFGAGLQTELVPALSQGEIIRRVLGRYPVWPVVIMVVLLFAYATFALAICIATALSHDRTLRVPGTRKLVSALALAQVRLTDPAALVAHTLTGQREDIRPELTAATSSLDMFDERQSERRLKIGLHELPEHGPSIFGIWTSDEYLEKPNRSSEDSDSTVLPTLSYR